VGQDLPYFAFSQKSAFPVQHSKGFFFFKPVTFADFFLKKTKKNLQIPRAYGKSILLNAFITMNYIHNQDILTNSFNRLGNFKLGVAW
jgi:hypothetical protein